MTATRAGRTRRTRTAALISVLLGCALAGAFRQTIGAHVRAVSLMLRLSNDHGWLSRLADTPVVEENLLLRSEFGAFRARIYRPRDGRRAHGMILAHGVHYMGIDEPRLRPFARNLARTGLVVMTPELAALADYRVEASSVREIEVAVQHLARDAHVESGGVTVMGLSFAGGLALLACADPTTRPHVSTVVALGAHHDLARVSRFLATDELETPQGVRHMRAHDYGLLVFFYANAGLFVEAAQAPIFRDVLRHMLHVDRASARRAAEHLVGDARVLYERIEHNDKPALAPLVLRVLPQLRAHAREVSPAGRIAGLAGLHVILMHGAADDVMPPTEAIANAAELSGRADVTLYVTPTIHHVTVEGPLTLRQRWQLVHVMAAVLSAG